MFEIIKIKWNILKAKICANSLIKIGIKSCNGQLYEMNYFDLFMEVGICDRCKYCKIYKKRR